MASRRRKTRKSRRKSTRRLTRRTSRRSRRSSKRTSVLGSAWKKKHPKARWACKKGGGFKGFAKKKNAKKVCAHPRKVRR